jgi:hypothetical protein
VTFASNSQVLDNFLKAGHIIGDNIPNQPPTFGGRICLDIDCFGLKSLNTLVNVEKSAECSFHNQRFFFRPCAGCAHHFL